MNKAICVLCTVLIFVLAFSGCTRTYADFTPERWESARPSSRASMAEYLAESELLIGKSRVEVQELLGDNGNDFGADDNLVAHEVGTGKGEMRMLYIGFNYLGYVRYVEPRLSQTEWQYWHYAEQW